MRERTQKNRLKRLTGLLLLGLFTLSMASMVQLKPALASAPVQIAPDVGVNPGDYQFQLTDYSNSYVKFGTNFYADQILMYGDKMYFTNIALGSASNPINNLGLGIQSGNATINAIGTNIVTTGITCDVATFCYPFYYYNLGQTLSRISVTQGSTTTAIPVSSFTTDFSAFSVMAAPAIYWDPTTRYYEVKIYYTGTTSISFESNTGGTGINPVSFESTATVYSVASDPDFQRVYQDTVNNKALFFDAEPTNGTYFESSYDIASGISTNTATGITNGGNTVNSATYFSPVELNGYVWAVGRDSTTGNNVYALRSTSALAAVNATSQASSYQPRDMVQSTSKLYSPLYDNSTANGNLYLGIQTRAYGSYSEPSLYAGTAPVPTYSTPASQLVSGSFNNLGTSVNSVAAETFTSTAALSGGTFDSLTLYLSKSGSPTGTATIGAFDSSGNVIQTFGTLDVSTLTGSEAGYTVNFAGGHGITSGDRIGIKYAGDGNPANLVQVYYDNANVYDGTNAYKSLYAGGWSDQTGADLKFSMRNSQGVKSVVYDGSPDTSYTFFESGTNTLRVVKYTSSATLLSGSMIHTAGLPFKVIQLTDKMIVQTATDTYVIPRATDTISLLYPNTFNTRYAQTFLLSPGGRTYSSNPVYIANSTYAINFTPSLGTGAQTGVIIDSVDDATGTMNVYAPAKYYYLTAQSLTVESSTLAGTTWTISQLGSMDQIAPTAWTERVGLSLTQNSTLFGDDVFRLVCDAAAYHYILPMVAIGDDSGCTSWYILPTSGDTTGRVLPYSRTSNLVHANPQTVYTIQLSATNPSVYRIETLYDNKVVDTSNFDSGGDASQRLLFGNCYTMEIIETSSGNVLQNGDICADSITTKTISLLGITIPANWLGNTWSYIIHRDYDNSTNHNASPTNNHVLFTFQKDVSPYNATINIVDKFFATPTYNQTFTYTEVSGVSVLNVTGINSNQTLYFTLSENGAKVLNAVSGPQSFNNMDIFGPETYGLLFGVPAAFVFPFLVAVIFPKSIGYFGAIVTVAIIGIMQVFGFIQLPVWYWGLVGPIVALAVVVGYKR